MKKATVEVNLSGKPPSSYPIFIEKGLINDLEPLLNQHCPAKKVLIVTDENVFKLYKHKINPSSSEFLILPPGEEHKNIDTYLKILNKAQEIRLERKDVIVALGGGVIGDITGFAAATILRGVGFVQVPTTLLSQVDSSVGGKTGINTAFGKNLIGAFYQPKLVLIDTESLETLDERQFKTGLAEVVKYAFIEKTVMKADAPSFYDFLVQNKDTILAKDPACLKKIIEICCKLKAEVVFQDELESGIRAVLNFGHTFGHAIEKCTGYSFFTHGEALAIGMKMVLKLSFDKELIDKPYLDSALALIDSYGLDYKMPPNVVLNDITAAMSLDKKVEKGKTRFVLAKNGFDTEITSDVTEDELQSAIKAFL